MDIRGDDLYRKVHTLTQRQLECVITPQEQQELETLLLDNDAARRMYAEYVQETACLRWGCQPDALDAVECSLAQPSYARRSAGRRLFRLVPLSAGLAIVLALVAVGWWSFQADAPLEAPHNGAQPRVVAARQPDRESVESPADREEKPASSLGQEVATITGLGAARWADNRESTRLLSRCRIGERLKLDEGTAELTFDAGAQVTVFAPADFLITSATSMQCDRGRVTTLVDERGRGFTIVTPRGTVEDLGTQFGIDISDSGETKVVVFQGSVDVTYQSTANSPERESSRRLEQGDALVIKNLGEPERLVSVLRDQYLDFTGSLSHRAPVIADVRDNIRNDHSVKSYQIVHGGLKDDVPCFVDRDHEWNGIDKAGLPKFLMGADYVMPFNDDKFVESLELTIYIVRPATLYIFLDNNMEVPDWVRNNFKDTGVDIGLDGASTVWHKENQLATGPGESVDFTFSIWQCSIKQPGAITLGGVKPPTNRSLGFNMYGIAAVATEFVTE